MLKDYKLLSSHIVYHIERDSKVMINIVVLNFFLCNLLLFLLFFTLLLTADLLIIPDRLQCPGTWYLLSGFTSYSAICHTNQIKVYAHTRAIRHKGESNSLLNMITAGKYLASQIQMVLATVCLGRQLYSPSHSRPASENPAQMVSLEDIVWGDVYSYLCRYFSSYL